MSVLPSYGLLQFITGTIMQNTVNYLTQFQFMGFWYLIWVAPDGTEKLEAIFTDYDTLVDYALG